MKSNAHFSGSECTPEHLCRFKQFIVQDSSTPRGIWQLKSPYPREFAIQGKKMPMPGGQPGGRGGGGGWAQVELTDALVFPWWLKQKGHIMYLLIRGIPDTRKETR